MKLGALLHLQALDTPGPARGAAWTEAVLATADDAPVGGLVEAVQYGGIAAYVYYLAGAVMLLATAWVWWRSRRNK